MDYYNLARTYYASQVGIDQLEPDLTISCDSSVDMAAAGQLPLTVFPSAMTNADQLKQEIKKTSLTPNTGVIFQSTQDR